MKKLQNHLFLLVIFIVLSSWAFGQHEFGIKVSGGISRIYGSLENQNHPSSTTTTSFSPSDQGGFFYNLLIGKKQEIGAELLYSHLEGGQTNTWDYNDIALSGVESHGSEITYERISYFSLPVYYGYTYKKLTINGGFQISYAFSSSGHYESSYVYTIIAEDGDRITREVGVNRELNNLTIKDFDFGPRAGVIYRLTKRLSIEGMFYYGIHNINQIKLSDEKLKIQQMTLGIRYALWEKKSK